MDILVSSNLERMLYIVSKGNSDYVAALQNDLKEKGEFEISQEMKKEFKELFYGGFCNDSETLETISYTFKKYGYLCDTHTAVALNVYAKYLKETGDSTQRSLLPLLLLISFPKVSFHQSSRMSLTMNLIHCPC